MCHSLRAPRLVDHRDTKWTTLNPRSIQVKNTSAEAILVAGTTLPSEESSHPESALLHAGHLCLPSSVGSVSSNLVSGSRVDAVSGFRGGASSPRVPALVDGHTFLVDATGRRSVAAQIALIATSDIGDSGGRAFSKHFPGVIPLLLVRVGL